MALLKSWNYTKEQQQKVMATIKFVWLILTFTVIKVIILYNEFFLIFIKQCILCLSVTEK